MAVLKKYDWGTLPFFTLSFLTCVIGLALYIPRFGIHPLEPIITVLLIYAVAFSIASGYHRLFAHRTYHCHPVLKVVYLILGAMAFQQSALKWAADHRQHHLYLDTEKDPYSITKGFFWAHIGWAFAKDPPDRLEKAKAQVPDLMKDPWVVWQHRYLYWIAIPLAFGLPLAIGFLIGRPLGMFLWAGVLRLVLSHHSTFTINSVTHMFGRQPYSDKNSGKDVWWLGPFFLFGENYHNYHHTFQADYRNGIKWYHFDPGKWCLWLFARLGWVHGLRRTPPHLILKARLEMDFKRLQQKVQEVPQDRWLPVKERLNGLRHALEEKSLAYSHAWKQYLESKSDWADRSRASIRQARQSLREKERACRELWSQWKSALRQAGHEMVQGLQPLSASKI